METSKENEKVTEVKKQKIADMADLNKMLPLHVVSLLLVAGFTYSYFGTSSSFEYISAVLLAVVNVLVAVFLDKKMVRTSNVFFWGLAMKLVKSFILFLILLALVFLGVSENRKSLVVGFAIGFFITHFFEVLILTKLLVLNKENHVK